MVIGSAQARARIGLSSAYVSSIRAAVGLATSGFSLIHATWTLASPPLNAPRSKLVITGAPGGRACTIRGLVAGRGLMVVLQMYAPESTAADAADTIMTDGGEPLADLDATDERGVSA